ncbi:unnamed protein product [Pleuronectes platessa]|uniref:Uncharacterized protein n=1 Tax=Pleuronectes platessa TaxID=8262 RepID=A0A9N7Y9L1_PLEPL|nr:unnamed protein product [Pleuronectes platessa]
MQEREAELWTTDPQMHQQGPAGARRGPGMAQRAREILPGWKVADTPARSRQESINMRRMRVKRGEERGGGAASGMVRGNCPRRASATKGIKEMRALDGKQANNHWDPFLPPFKH